MASEVWHDLGPVPGGCTICGADGDLSMSERRSRRSLAERLRREHVPPPSRQVLCRSCGWRWSVRSTDRAATAVTTRAGTTPEPRRHDDPPLASRTVLPAPRLGGSSRDWMYDRT